MSSLPPLPRSGASLGLDPGEADPAVEALPFDIPEEQRYTAGGLLGQGGMGEVRSALDRRLGRVVALKRPLRGDAETQRRLSQEAALTARLAHPAIVPVHDAGRDQEGRPFYTMPVVRGRSLAEAALGQPLPERLRLIRHLQDAARALAYAHSEGLLHRDVKPGNILIGPFGETMLVDWGLAGPPGEPARTSGGGPIGTPGYMPPEQRRGEALDPSADVHALGQSLRELLQGHPPGEGAPWVPGPEVPPELAAIVQRATEPEPVRRYRDAWSLAEELDAWFEGRRVMAHRYSAVELLRRFWSAWRLPILALLLAAAGIGAALSWGIWRSTAEAERARAAEREANLSRQRAEQNLARAQVAQALEAAQRGERAAAEILAASALTRGEFPDARGVLTTVDAEGLPQRLESWPSPRCEAREMSLDGHLLACARGDRILVWRPGEEPQIIRPMEATRLAFAGAEALVVSSQVTATTVLPLDGTARLATDLVGLTTPLSAPWANPAIWQQSSVLKRMDRRTGAIDMLPAPCLNTPWGLGLRAARAMPDGDLYLICGDGRLQVQNLHRLDPTREVGRYDKAWGEPVALDVWMAGGRGTAAVGTTYGHVVLFDLPSGSVRHVLGERGSSIHRLAAGERQVAVSPERGELQVWDIESGLQVVRLPVQRATLRWLERGRLRVWSEQVEDWRVPAEAPWLAVRSAEAGISRLDLSPDGSLIASAHGDGVVRIWDRYHSNPRQQLFLHQSVAKSVSFSPDGQSIAAIAAAENEVHIYSVADGKEQRRLAATRGRRVLWTERGLLLAPFTSDLWWWPELEAPPKVLSTGAKIFELTPEGGRILAEDALDRLWSVELHRSPPLRLEERPRGHIPFRRSPEMSWSSTRTAVTTHVEGRPYATAELADLELRNLHVVSGGKLLAAGHLDGTISLLALPSLERVATLRGHLSRISSLLSDPAGRFLYSGSWDGQLRAWDLAALEAEPTGLLRRLEAAWGRDAEALTLR